MDILPAFVHIEKAAGTSIIHLLRDAYAGRYVDVRPLCKGEAKYLQADDLGVIVRIYGRPACIGGHAIAPYSDLQSRYPGIRYFTIFRDPQRRFVSQFQYWRKNLGYAGSFEEFLGRGDTCNVQTRHIVGGDDVDGAIELLQERFFLVGVLEQLERFLVTLRAALRPRLDQAVLPRVNVTRQETEASKLLELYGDDIAAANELDQQLYAHARDCLIPEFEARYPAPDSLTAQPATTLAGRLLARCRKGADYALRKCYLQPVTGIIRLKNGLPFRGSYRHF